MFEPMGLFGHAFCNGCQTWKSLDDFHECKSSSSGKLWRCKACTNKKARSWRASRPDYTKTLREKNPKYFRNVRLKHRYNLTLEEYELMLEQQGRVCAICKKPETRKVNGVPTPLAVDHCHQTGKVRGLLCHRCNLNLGVIEQAEWLVAAQDYLAGAQPKPKPDHESSVKGT